MPLNKYPTTDGSEIRTIGLAPGVEAITGVGAPLTSVNHAIIAATLTALEQQVSRQSPNWEQYKNWPNNAFINEGFPFDEGFPSGGPFGNQNVMYEIITRDGVRHDAQVDYSTQYRSEGLQWLTTQRETLGKQVVVAWRRKE